MMLNIMPMIIFISTTTKTQSNVMPNSNIIPAETDAEIWKIIEDQLTTKNDTQDYTAQFSTNGQAVTLDIDIDPERADESGKALTSFSAKLPPGTAFRFRIVPQRFKQTIGKLFGMQDVIIGDPEFDRQFLIQSNDEEKVKEILSNETVSGTLLGQPVAEFDLREDKIGAFKEVVLVLDIEGAITEPDTLKTIYQAFATVLHSVV
jgi:hypothetical protein